MPTVLDSAAEILTLDVDDKEGMDSIAIVAPVPFELQGGGSGFTSPISQMSSRSPSPNGTSNRRSMLANLPSPSPSFTLPLPHSPQAAVGGVHSPSRPLIQTHSPPAVQAPIISTPTSAHFSVTSDDSPTTATHTDHPLHPFSGPASPGAATPTAGATLGSHVPPSPKNPSKRLSFLSYTDLLSSTHQI